jgi:hypothetical protein
MPLSPLRLGMLALALLRTVTDVLAPPALLHTGSAQPVAHRAPFPNEQSDSESEHLSCICASIARYVLELMHRSAARRRAHRLDSTMVQQERERERERCPTLQCPSRSRCSLIHLNDTTSRFERRERKANTLSLRLTQAARLTAKRNKIAPVDFGLGSFGIWGHDHST